MGNPKQVEGGRSPPPFPTADMVGFSDSYHFRPAVIHSSNVSAFPGGTSSGSSDSHDVGGCGSFGCSSNVCSLFPGVQARAENCAFSGIDV